ncbi:uncharacterized protein LOC128889481 [Hylaeus anthracinus]|uniref:uncharacterized protein LOC128889481 n=1 Tax=Hylaeus anthracinus TaxID=313031 RepID=UPI0023BA1C90|nr:uncharacterized protein LOC128889481 [Hylaeus anthracinus]
MACVDSYPNSGEPAYAANSLIGDTDTVNIPTKKDSFQCTFFRQPKSIFAIKNAAWQLSCSNPMSSSFSDIGTDSDSELDETVASARWLEKSRHFSEDVVSDDTPKLETEYHKYLNTPRITFDPMVRVDSDIVIRSYPRKRSMKEENEAVSVKLPRVSKKWNEPWEKDNSASKENHEEFDENRVPNHCDNQTTFQNETFLENYTNNDKLMRALSAARNVLHGNKRSYKLANVAANKEVTSKRRKTIESRIIRNKRLLTSMKEVIRTMEEPLPDLESIQPIDSGDKTAKSNVARVEDGEDLGRSTKISNDWEEREMRGPTIKSPKLEKHLDKSMQKAVNKYRTYRNTWKKLKQQQFTSQDLPEKKNPVSWLPLQNCFTLSTYLT